MNAITKFYFNIVVEGPKNMNFTSAQEDGKKLFLWSGP